MEPNLLRYIWSHTRKQQAWILAIVLLSMIPYFAAFDLPKQIINGPIQGIGFEQPDSTALFMAFSFDIPFTGWSIGFDGVELNRLSTLMALSGVFLLLVIINGLFKFYINTFKGRLGERLLRRIRFELVDRVLRFPPAALKQVHGAEISTMVKDEVEPFGGFTGDAFVQPAMLGGQAAAALFFIFLQNVWLGLIAAVMVGIQVGIIPKMRRRLIELGRQRQITARHLAGKVGEIVDGIETIHAFDTSNYERADIAERLGQIYKIRFDLYQWKFLVKFINNFLSQLTPFLFYSIGGYFALRGSLDVGQLVAVINAYKDLPGPLKELIDWDQARQDVQVKYEQVLEQFQPGVLIDPRLHEPGAVASQSVEGALHAHNLTIIDGSGVKVVDNANLRIEPGETVAIIDNIGSGGEGIARAFGRLVWPAAGRITLGEMDLLDLPESVAGRRISYVSPDSYLFHGTLKDNLVYGLKHAPFTTVSYSGRDAIRRRWDVNEARLAGNPDLDLSADWIDRRSTSVLRGFDDDLKQSVMRALDAVQLTEDVMELALHSFVDPEENPVLAERVVAMRHALREALQAEGLAHVVAHFDPAAYNMEATVGENLFFAATRSTSFSDGDITDSPEVFDVLDATNLSGMLYGIGLTIAENLVEIFADLPPDHPFFQQLDRITSDDIAFYQQFLQRQQARSAGDVSREERGEILRLSLHYIEPRYRLGVLTPEAMEAIVAARDRFYEHLPADLRSRVERYDPHRYMAAATLRENVLFGKLSYRVADAAGKLRPVAARIMEEQGLYESFIALGLSFDVGSSGRRLTLAQRHKLSLARALVRRSDFYVFNRALPGLDRRMQEEIVGSTIEFLRGQDNNPTIIWVLSNTSLSRMFHRVIVFDRGQVVEDGSFETLDKESGIFKSLVA
ncbi:ABC transporter transmembrane domain-containing protein [Rhizobium sp. SSA_523]|uniref:ABC transporter transmembrane domain-containing protein n=1 Tax=Rhizobium sp. SSA_523 TaxID=2952477 RepID=UPI00209199D2|nr:ABC transporter transmembrane domain-containing protein [Rhizobium sp. SSA_523]MCO5732347.1 ABC transporter transmembrane domain-containing protein [Rhizobium sp. SSA_523]WKC21254.1 ABC transporter transmembrane domain-containing protein [Rhizobium sp. SSA_523]